MNNNNKIVVNLDKVTHARLQYKAHSYGITLVRDKCPISPTVNGRIVWPNEVRYGSSELMFDYATRRDLLDDWYPELELQLSNNHSLIYTGQKALDLWECWKAKIFSSNNKKKGNKND